MSSFVILAALLLGPALAAVGALAFVRWDQAHQRRLEIFRSMMRSRRLWLTPDWILSLNLIPIEFGKYPEVIEALDTLYARYSDPAWRDGNIDRRRRVVFDTETAACELTLRVARALKIEIRGADLRTRPLAPFGWVADDVQRRQTWEMLQQVLSGQRALKIEQFAPQPAQPVAQPAQSAHVEPNGAGPWFEPSRAEAALHDVSTK